MLLSYVLPHLFQLCFHSHMHASYHAVPLPGMLYLQTVFFTEILCSLIKTELHGKAFPISERHQELPCGLCSISVLLQQLMSNVQKLSGDISVGLSAYLPVLPTSGIIRVHSKWQIVNKCFSNRRGKYKRYKV